MKKLLFALVAFLVFSGHDMFLKLDTYFLEPGANATIKLFNGTFDKSENVIDRDRMIDVSLVGNGERIRLDTNQWSERDSMTLLSFRTGEPGTWVAGVSTRARNIEMAAADFNRYLEHDGILDMIEWRKENNALDQDAVEKYSKHVKTIFQVGDQTTDDWQAELGYPLEFVPLNNPYDLHLGETLQLQLLRDGAPLANQLVYVDAASSHGHSHAAGEGHDHEHTADAEHAHQHGDEGHNHDHAEEGGHTHEHGLENEHSHAEGEHDHSEEGHTHDHDEVEESTEEDHHHHSAAQYRTDAEGKMSFDLTSEGIWYVRTIDLVTSRAEGLTHESNWATLTFELGHGHSHADRSHHHGEGEHHHDEGGIPGYVFWLGSIALVGGLFFWFNRSGE